MIDELLRRLKSVKRERLDACSDANLRMTLDEMDRAVASRAAITRAAGSSGS